MQKDRNLLFAPPRVWQSDACVSISSSLQPVVRGEIGDDRDDGREAHKSDPTTELNDRGPMPSAGAFNQIPFAFCAKSPNATPPENYQFVNPL